MNSLFKHKKATTQKTFFIDKHWLRFLLDETLQGYTDMELDMLNMFIADREIKYVYEPSDVALFDSTKRHCEVSGTMQYEVVEIIAEVYVSEQLQFDVITEVQRVEMATFEHFINVAYKGEV